MKVGLDKSYHLTELLSIMGNVLDLLVVDLQTTLRSDLLICQEPRKVLTGFGSSLGYQSGRLFEVFEELEKLNPDLHNQRWNDIVGPFAVMDDPEDFSDRTNTYCEMYRMLFIRSLDRVRQNIKTFLEFLFIFEYEVPSLSTLSCEMGQLLRKFLMLDVMCRMEAYLKFQTASFTAKMLKQDKHSQMPESKFYKPEFFLVGSMNKFLRKKLFSNDLEFGFTMLKIGKGMSPLTFLSVVDELKDHAEQMTREVITSENLKFEVGRTVAELCGQFTEDEINLIASGQPLLTFSPTVPSNAACFERNRGDGGCLTEICDPVQLLYKKQYQMGHLFVAGDDSLDTNDSFANGIKLFSTLDSQQIWENLLTSELDRQRWAGHLGGFVHATVVALREPFKVRVITKAEAKANYLGVPFQRFMHSTLRRNPILLALDRPLTTKDMNDMLFNIKKQNKHWKFVSGDYKGATNLINSDATRVALGAFMARMNISNEIQDYLENVVANQTIHYTGSLNGFKSRKTRDGPFTLDSNFEPDLYYRFGNDPETVLPGPVTQTNGQLMGSILSFPLLCAINLAIFRVAVELYHEEMGLGLCSLKRAHELYGVLINGDDILFVAPERLIEIWYEQVNGVGLVLSIGKNYVHPDIFTINSQMFKYTSRGITQIKYVNWLLIHPEYDEQLTMTSFFRTCDKLQHDCLELLSPNLRFRVNSVLLDSYVPLLKRVTEEIPMNWFIPRELGGLGLETYQDFKIAEWQRRLATYMATRSSPRDYQLMKIVYSKRVIPPQLLHKLSLYGELADQVGYEFVPSCEHLMVEDEILPKILGMDPFAFKPFDPTTEEVRAVRALLRTLNKYASQGCGSMSPMSDEKIFSFIPRELQLRPHHFELTERVCSYPVLFDPLDLSPQIVIDPVTQSQLLQKAEHSFWHEQFWGFPDPSFSNKSPLAEVNLSGCYTMRNGYHAL